MAPRRGAWATHVSPSSHGPRISPLPPTHCSRVSPHPPGCLRAPHPLPAPWQGVRPGLPPHPTSSAPLGVFTGVWKKQMCKWQLIPHSLPGDLQSIHRCGQTCRVSQWAIDTPPASSVQVPREDWLHCHQAPSAWPDPAPLALCRPAEMPHWWGFSVISACGEGPGSPHP